VLALAAVNVLGAVVFAGLYAVAGRWPVSPVAMAIGLSLVFAGMTALWVNVEQRSRALDPWRRIGRVAIGVVAVVIGLPVTVLMPLFWLESQLPPEAVPLLNLGPVMALLLVAVVLVVAVNGAGGIVTLVLGVARRWRGIRSG
jgi:hypothetical protein